MGILVFAHVAPLDSGPSISRDHRFSISYQRNQR